MTDPIVRWAGGKRALLPTLTSLLPADYRTRRHVEPFAGGAALFFALEPESAVLMDANRELINTYSAVRDDVTDVIDALWLHWRPSREGAEYYYEVRELFNGCNYGGEDRAAAFLYLNRTCFNGLYRVNRMGEFNVPFGKRKFEVDEDNLRAASSLLFNARLAACDFERVLDFARPGDFVYLDPPYDGAFGSYTKAGFTIEDQSRLARVFVHLDMRGCKVMLSNANTPLIRELYSAYDVTEVTAPRRIRPDAERQATEVVVKNYAV